MKTGLVLEGGGMRGLFTAGVLDVMMERGIKVDGRSMLRVQLCIRTDRPCLALQHEYEGRPSLHGHPQSHP